MSDHSVDHLTRLAKRVVATIIGLGIACIALVTLIYMLLRANTWVSLGVILPAYLLSGTVVTMLEWVAFYSYMKETANEPDRRP